MVYHGHIENGVVVLDDTRELPEGARVIVQLDESVKGKDTSIVGRQWKGICRDMGPVPTDEDIAEMRREAWPD